MLVSGYQAVVVKIEYFDLNNPKCDVHMCGRQEVNGGFSKAVA